MVLSWEGGDVAGGRGGLSSPGLPCLEEQGGKGRLGTSQAGHSPLPLRVSVRARPGLIWSRVGTQGPAEQTWWWVEV